MGRPRGFDEAEVVRSAAGLFAGRAYDGISIDDLVTHLGLHRNSLYKTFGSKRGLYLAALRWYLAHDVAPLIDRVARAGDPGEVLGEALRPPGGGPGLDLLLLAAVERAPVDDEVAELVTRTFTALDGAAGGGAAGRETSGDGTAGHDGLAIALTAAALGLRIRSRAGASPAETGRARAALAERLDHH
ncbi:TetR/AcrR family transcriptional regulator [Streptomyces sp. NPDC001985]|uniref:TetR/AcrR family transcriptional regulator n=1 Tax=Streptomyces sp. NPDC001985 TaxID=3154406 RepID=UPI00331ADBAA